MMPYARARKRDEEKEREREGGEGEAKFIYSLIAQASDSKLLQVSSSATAAVERETFPFRRRASQSTRRLRARGDNLFPPLRLVENVEREASVWERLRR